MRARWQSDHIMYHLLLGDSPSLLVPLPFSFEDGRQVFRVELGEPNGVAGKNGVPVDLGVCVADPGIPTPLKRFDILSQSNTKSKARYASQSHRTSQQRGIDKSKMSGIIKGIIPRRVIPMRELSM